MDLSEYFSTVYTYEFIFERIRQTRYQPPPSELEQALYTDFKDLLSAEFDRLHASLKLASDEPLHASLSFIISALGKIGYAVKAKSDINDLPEGDPKKNALSTQYENLLSQARLDFSTSHNEAVKAFLQASGPTSYDKKALATKIRILTILHSNSYFNTELRSMNMQAIEDFIMTVWNEYVALPEVRNALQNEYEGTLVRTLSLMVIGEKESRKNVITQTAKIRSIIGEILTTYLPIMNSKNEDIDVSNVTTQLLEGHGDFVQSLAVFGGRLYSGSADNTIKVWSLADDPFPSECLGTLYGHNNEVITLVARKGKLYSGSKDHTIKVWDISSDMLPAFPIVTYSEHSFSVYGLAINEAGILFSCSGDKTIKAWDTSAPTKHTSVGTLTGHTEDVNAIAVSENKVYSGSYHTIKVWSIEFNDGSFSGTELGSLSSHKDWVTTLIISNNRLYSASTDAINIWDISASDLPLKPLITLHEEGHDVNKLLISGGRLYTGIGAQDTTVEIWDIGSDPEHIQPVATLPGEKGSIFALAVLGGRLFTGSDSEAIVVRYV